MSQYKCKSGFTSNRGKNYFMGSRIGYSEYAALSYSEQFHFEQEQEERHSGSSGYNSEPSYTPPADFGSSSSDSGSSHSSENFGGFGGGSFGGGGASGSWDSGSNSSDSGSSSSDSGSSDSGGGGGD